MGWCRGARRLKGVDGGVEDVQAGGATAGRLGDNRDGGGCDGAESDPRRCPREGHAL